MNWMQHTPVYNAQVKTASVASVAGLQWWLIRRRREFRNTASKAARWAAAGLLRQYRREKRPFPPPVPPTAMRVDLEAELREMGMFKP